MVESVKLKGPEGRIIGLDNPGMDVGVPLPTC